ncbi:MAG: hypothetical protein DMD82_04405 [Candidatus Rokuibacteriota bacterium]|nr:MAG: hypothetical protein DMD82_04405 [Candidatus Rokubacteria bacterium]
MFAAWWSRAFRPPRTIWPTREGWWLLFAAVGLGFAAMNTGNNLLYLLVSMLLGLIVVSGILSERSMRGLRISMTMPGEIYAGRPALFGAAVVNRKPWAASYSITLEILGREARPRLLYVPRLASGAEHFFTWEDVLPRRGRQQLAGVRITTRFPFGLFLKAGRAVVGPDVVVYPSVGAISLERVALLGIGETVSRRGRASDLFNLREYRWGDDPRLIHWRSTAKAATLMVRELGAEATVHTRIILDPTGPGEASCLEAGLSEAASLAVHLLRSGASVELVGPGVDVALGSGRPHERRILTALALYELGARIAPTAAPAERGRSPVSLREIRVALGQARPQSA